MADTKYTTVTPVLSSSTGYVTDVQDQVAALVRNVVMNPGWTSSLWQDYLVSFRTLASKYEDDRSAFAYQMSQHMATVLHRMFKNYSFDCDFKTEDYDPEKESATYTIKFNILINDPESSDTESALVMGTITVDPNTNDIGINFDSNDAALLL